MALIVIGFMLPVGVWGQEMQGGSSVGTQEPAMQPGSSVGTPGSSAQSFPTFPNPFNFEFKTIPEFIAYILYNIVMPLGLVVIVFFIIRAGFIYVTAGGDSGAIEKAHKNFLAVVIGAAVLLGSVAIASIINGTICQIAGNIPGLCENGGAMQIQLK